MMKRFESRRQIDWKGSNFFPISRHKGDEFFVCVVILPHRQTDGFPPRSMFDAGPFRGFSVTEKVRLELFSALT